MGLFNFGKKKEADNASAAPEVATKTDSAEMKKCAMCGEEKPASEGKMMMEGTAFRCNDCAQKDDGEEHGEVCEFC